jgi:hypothetical protein
MILERDNFIKVYVGVRGGDREKQQGSQNIAINDEILLLEMLR